MTQPYAYAVWIVRAGCEEDFVSAWRELAEWTEANAPGAGVGRLFQDDDQPSRFMSLWSWDDEEAIAVWRSQLGFQERVGRLRELLETYTPATFRMRIEVAAARPSTPSAWVNHVEARHGRT
jgi:heme-degrading monooxygenase HmoA